MAFNDNLKRLRESAGLSRKQLSDILHMNQNAYGMYETGKREPNLSKLINIAAVLNVTTDELLGVSPPDEYRSCKKALEEIGFEIYKEPDGKLLVRLGEKGRKDKELERIYDAAGLAEIGFSSSNALVELVKNAKSSAIKAYFHDSLISHLLPWVLASAQSSPQPRKGDRPHASR